MVHRHTFFHGPVYVTFQSAYDQKNERIEDEVLMICSIHADVQQWEALSKDVYKEVKRALTEGMFSEIERVLTI